MDHDETGCQAPLEGPILCINNCGFFGSTTTMNMCSKCHKDYSLNQDNAKLAASSIGSIVNGSPNRKGKELVIMDSLKIQVDPVEPKVFSTHSSSSDQLLDDSIVVGCEEVKAKTGPNRCGTCNKRVGLTGFKCRCGSMYCGLHRYSDKHECPFDYHTAAQDSIAKANPVVKADKLDKI